MTKEEVLQKVTDYCNEKSYTNATLTEGFRDKFADHFQKAHPDGNIEDEAILGSLKFALSTAFSSASELATVKVNEFTSKENDYKNQIAELNNKIAQQPNQQQQQQQQFEIPKEITEKLEELERYKTEQSKQEKRKAIMALAKANIQPTLHSSFEEYFKDYDVKLDKDEKEQATALVSKYQSIMKDTYGTIKPLAPQQTEQHDKEVLESIPKVKVC